MNNEIKEILDKLKKKEEIYLFQRKNETSFNSDEYEAHLLLDYITDLQEENKNLKNEQISKYQTLKDLQEENERLKVELNNYKAKQKLENDIKMQQSYLDYYRTMTRGDKE